MSGPCTHRTLEFHSARYSDGKRRWRCSCCGKIDIWGLTWGYQGNYECPHCSMADIEWVACSMRCRMLLESGAATPIDKEFPVAKVLSISKLSKLSPTNT